MIEDRIFLHPHIVWELRQTGIWISGVAESPFDGESYVSDIHELTVKAISNYIYYRDVVVPFHADLLAFCQQNAGDSLADNLGAGLDAIRSYVPERVDNYEFLLYMLASEQGVSLTDTSNSEQLNSMVEQSQDMFYMSDTMEIVNSLFHVTNNAARNIELTLNEYREALANDAI